MSAEGEGRKVQCFHNEVCGRAPWEGREEVH